MNVVQKRLQQALINAGVKEEVAASSVTYYKGQPDFSSTLPSICPICNANRMIDVNLTPYRKARYCPHDRTCIPYPVSETVSDEKLSQVLAQIKLPRKETSMFAG